MSSLSLSFKDRVQEIDSYLDLLDALERQAQMGPPKLGGGPITAQQQKIMYSAVYLQLYNLVEATVTWCLDAVCAASLSASWGPRDLTEELRREWIRTAAQTHADLNRDRRLRATVSACEHLLSSLPLEEWAIERRSAGSWDDHLIEDITKKLGCNVKFSPDNLAAVKRKIRDDKSALELVKDFRNRLAHGSLSFTECGDGVTVTDLRNIKDWTATYLQEVVCAFERFIASHEFLSPAARPVAGGAT